MNIEYLVSAAEELEFPTDTFDVVTACQCYWYFDFGRLLPGLRRMMKADGSFLLLYMAWLPYETPLPEPVRSWFSVIVPRGQEPEKPCIPFPYRNPAWRL